MRYDLKFCVQFRFVLNKLILRTGHLLKFNGGMSLPVYFFLLNFNFFRFDFRRRLFLRNRRQCLLSQRASTPTLSLKIKNFHFGNFFVVYYYTRGGETITVNVGDVILSSYPQSVQITK